MYIERKVKRFVVSNTRKEIREAVKKLSTQVEVEFPVNEIEKKEKHSVIAAVKMQYPREKIIKKPIKMVKKKDPEALNEDIAVFYLVKLCIIKGKVPDFKMYKDYIDRISDTR